MNHAVKSPSGEMFAMEAPDAASYGVFIRAGKHDRWELAGHAETRNVAMLSPAVKKKMADINASFMEFVKVERPK